MIWLLLRLMGEEILQFIPFYLHFYLDRDLSFKVSLSNPTKQGNLFGNQMGPM